MAVEIENDKASLAEVRDEDMISWDQLPLAGNFKVPKPGGKGNRHPEKPPEG